MKHTWLPPAQLQFLPRTSWLAHPDSSRTWTQDNNDVDDDAMCDIDCTPIEPIQYQSQPPFSENPQPQDQLHIPQSEQIPPKNSIPFNYPKPDYLMENDPASVSEMDNTMDESTEHKSCCQIVPGPIYTRPQFPEWDRIWGRDCDLHTESGLHTESPRQENRPVYAPNPNKSAATISLNRSLNPFLGGPETTRIEENIEDEGSPYEYFRTRVVEELMPSNLGAPPRRRRITETIGRRPVEIKTMSASQVVAQKMWHFFYPSILIFITLVCLLVGVSFVRDVEAARLAAAKAAAHEYKLQWEQDKCEMPSGKQAVHCYRLDELRLVETHLEGGWQKAMLTVVAEAFWIPVGHWMQGVSGMLASLSVLQSICLGVVLLVLVQLSWIFKKKPFFFVKVRLSSKC
eukprot:Protomagalhaensia_sp_Gyna_25__1748@NODE_1918_length_1418_cov_10_979695_g1578_i0_p1_GENE_NODE_1918_length_1418_cov_10_979695_g1578_i0NODE_1918_length_1418_cov_10_979695_g1578_i0_p1_ORF_typecomplete_len401_score49_37YesK/PF14150_6/2YesK/PF14150_6/83_NODE_1918_length_1418_cov_10_979695_g1578_i02101412